ncbi:MAG: hypothetical protein A4E67_01058 [Syntrophaceae bacterium PtaB.Bin038]|jgi:hypothetical protein|nr:MAG: hypothetical protein A4E67_01058 [Syntrophaceae bacterium PtaB.Bin038]
MKKLALLLAMGVGLLFAGDLGASAPVKVTIRGCVTGGVLVSERVDFGSHDSAGGHRIRTFGPGGEPFNLSAYEGRRISFSGHLLPGDVFHAEARTLWVFGPCKAAVQTTVPPAGSGPEYRNPTYRNIRVDRCWRFGEECDQAAADRFCRMNGYAGSTDWAHAAHRPTYIIGDNRICDESFCEGFTYIRCGVPK